MIERKSITFLYIPCIGLPDSAANNVNKVQKLIFILISIKFNKLKD